jgi:hypothetical protein
MGLVPTLALASGVLLFTLFCGWRGARRPNATRGPRIVPWRFVMLLAFMGFVIVIAHLMKLLTSHGV